MLLCESNLVLLLALVYILPKCLVETLFLGSPVPSTPCNAPEYSSRGIIYSSINLPRHLKFPPSWIFIVKIYILLNVPRSCRRRWGYIYIHMHRQGRAGQRMQWRASTKTVIRYIIREECTTILYGKGGHIAFSN